MRVLVACEYSGTVRDQFILAGHDALSCDILPTEAPGWHIEGDLLSSGLLTGYWDLIIAHPPCTYLTIAGAGAYNRPEREEKRRQATEFFKAIQSAPNCPRIAIENPIPFKSVTKEIGQYDQIINPFEFGHPQRKKICLWLKGLPPLMPTNIVDVPEPKYCIRKTGPRAGQRYNYYFHQGKSGKERARFFSGIAEAMAQQWGNL